MEPFIGQITLFGGNFAPRGWALCNGQLLAIAQNQALFSILGTTYGGNGRTDFGLPDLRGRIPMHPGSGPGLTQRRLGETGGVENVTLNTTQLPAHTHAASASARCSDAAGTSDNPEGNVWAGSSEGDQVYASSANETMGDTLKVDVGTTGGNQGHPNVQPFACVNYIIALVGVFRRETDTGAITTPYGPRSDPRARSLFGSTIGKRAGERFPRTSAASRARHSRFLS